MCEFEHHDLRRVLWTLTLSPPKLNRSSRSPTFWQETTVQLQSTATGISGCRVQPNQKEPQKNSKDRLRSMQYIYASSSNPRVQPVPEHKYNVDRGFRGHDCSPAPSQCPAEANSKPQSCAGAGPDPGWPGSPLSLSTLMISLSRDTLNPVQVQ